MTTPPPPPWLDRLRVELDEEFQGRPAVAALATADAEGAPSVRLVVVRRLDPDTGAAVIATDARSDKAAHLRNRPEAEISFWLPGPRVQYRLRGTVRIEKDLGPPVAAANRTELWLSLSDAARALFAWPAPGLPRTKGPGAFPDRVPSSAAIPDTFLALSLRPDRVERLDLRPHPHQRTRWRIEIGWVLEELNP
jgi:pyridoxamine 5'-phosphate oxidase